MRKRKIEKSIPNTRGNDSSRLGVTFTPTVSNPTSSGKGASFLSMITGIPGFKEITVIVMHFLFFASSSSFADRITEIVPQSTRGLSMGGAGVAISNDSYAMFVNPANLAHKQIKMRAEILNIQGDMATGSFDAFASKRISPVTLPSLYPYLKSNPSRWGGHRFSAFPNFTSRYFSFGLLYQQNYGSQYKWADLTTGKAEHVRVLGYQEISPAAALSFRIWGGILKFGYSIRTQTISKGARDITSPDTSQLSYLEGLTTATGLNMTGAMTLTLPYAHLPTFGVILRNIGGTNKPVDKTPMHLDAGVGHVTYFGRSVHLRLAADYRDVTNQLKANFMRKFMTGLELQLWRTLSFRGGYGQGYPAAGFGLNLRSTRIDFAWYSEEMADRLRTERNQRYSLQFSWSLF